MASVKLAEKMEKSRKIIGRKERAEGRDYSETQIHLVCNRSGGMGVGWMGTWVRKGMCISVE